MEKETVLILSLLKPMTNRSQLNDIAIMIYNGGYPELKCQFLDYSHYFDENHMKDKKIKKRFCFIIIESNDKNKSTNGKSKEDVFRRVLSPK